MLSHFGVICTAAVLLAVPPLSNQARDQDAELIAVGRVTKIDSHEVGDAGSSNIEFTAELEVVKLERELIAGKTPKTLSVHYKRTGKRPPGWTGPAGQSSLFSVGDKVRIFGRYDGNGSLQLLEPNGWEKAN